MANADVDVLGYLRRLTLDAAMERRGLVEVCRQQTAGLVRLYFYL